MTNLHPVNSVCTVAEAAIRIGCTTDRVRWLARSGKLEGRKSEPMGATGYGDWILDRLSVEKYKRSLSR